jgi:putative FmdB family regulatory protein
MPIYEYKCAKCGVVEVMQGIKEASLKKCPNCKSKVERMISSSSFVLKGSGWYATDYAKKSTPPPADSSSATNGTNGTASSSEGAKSTTTEKSASAAESKPAASSEKTTSSAKPASSGKSD